MLAAQTSRRINNIDNEGNLSDISTRYIQFGLFDGEDGVKHSCAALVYTSQLFETQSEFFYMAMSCDRV